MIEYEIPCINDFRADSCEHDMATLSWRGRMVCLAMTDQAQTN
jgi:hypothetical protein